MPYEVDSYGEGYSGFALVRVPAAELQKWAWPKFHVFSLPQLSLQGTREISLCKVEIQISRQFSTWHHHLILLHNLLLLRRRRRRRMILLLRYRFSHRRRRSDDLRHEKFIYLSLNIHHLQKALLIQNPQLLSNARPHLVKDYGMLMSVSLAEVDGNTVSRRRVDIESSPTRESLPHSEPIPSSLSSPESAIRIARRHPFSLRRLLNSPRRRHRHSDSDRLLLPLFCTIHDGDVRIRRDCGRDFWPFG
ncbi:hypothetical protein GCK72_004258 [Caenorhabditis remanei]|uniref:Uncharacterized protein n=1 Tax=Caenorhabditis remanei TaxID=31234 RepID=A0A6A5HBP3_CAERE|nr:hypothetical protein GCK72_004258 [Caenorhabditis remanei]KAF1764311.1 hypothetical protein GCK72_004258 [Caenorhabditis remanei]